MREPRRFPRPSRHVTPSQKASSPEKLTRPIPQRSAPTPRLAVERLRPQSRKTCRPSEKHTFAIPQRSAPLHAARGRTVASTKQENMSRKTNATASTNQENMSPFRKTHIRHPPPKGARRPAARGRTVASIKQENMSRKSPATATATSHSQSRKTCRPSEKHTFAIPQRSAPPRGSRSNGCVHKSGKHVAKIPCNRTRLDDCSCLLLICYRTDGNIVWVLRKS